MMILHRNNFKASLKAANNLSNQLEESEKKSESNPSNLVLTQSTVNYDQDDDDYADVNLERRLPS